MDADSPFLSPEKALPCLHKVRQLQEMAQARDQALAQMALAWVLRTTTTAIIGASSVQQVEDHVAALARPDFSADEVKWIVLIEQILAQPE